MPWKRRCRNGRAIAMPFKAKALDAWLPRGEQQTLIDELTAGTSPCPALLLLAYISQCKVQDLTPSSCARP